MKNIRTAITPTRAGNYPEWYQQVIRSADLAENSPTRGSMIIKPWGYSIWENIQLNLDGLFKETGHENAYFPLLIPLRFFEKEAEHVEGFAKECAVVTHHKLESDSDGKLVPAGELEEPLVIRPTSETIIGDAFSRWVQSYRDLPILINQWANVMRWEMRTRLFLRTSEFLWQEGHTVHSTQEEAEEETMRMLDVYETFANDYLAIPVIKGEKTPEERFPGAVATYTIEAMMQDKKALQCGTSHFLGQNFSRASNIKFLNENGEEVFAWTTSWGVSTRLIGGIIMTHSDDDGLAVPPRIAPVHIVILPVYKEEKDRRTILEYADKLLSALKGVQYFNSKVKARIDKRDMRGGDKLWDNVKKGIPLRVEIGMREIEGGVLSVGRRDKPARERMKMSGDELVSSIPDLLDDIHNNMLKRALAFQKGSTVTVKRLKEFKEFFSGPESGGFAVCYGSIDAEDHDGIQELLKELKVSARCIPFEGSDRGTCIFTEKENQPRIIFARAY